MSDPNDPFAAHPYSPPSERGTDTDTQDALSGVPDSEPEEQGPVADQQQPPAEPAPADSSTEDTVQVEQPPRDHAYDDREQTVILPVDAQDDEGTPPPPRGRRTLAGTLALVVLAAGAGIGGAAAYDAIRGDDSSVVSSLEAGSDTDSAPAGEIEKVAQKLLPSVVQINVAGGGQAGCGTGISHQQ